MLIGVVKGLHILAVIAWMSGLLYLPRLYAYHSRATTGSDMDVMFKRMERGLLNIIMTPAAIFVVVLGGTLVALEGVQVLRTPWMMLKLLGVAFLLGWHIYLMRARADFVEGRRVHTEKFWRMMNETPFIAAIVIVLSVTTKFVL
jgi:putative membrane protein